MNDYWAKHANVLDPNARECYNKKLEHSEPDMYFVQRTTHPLTQPENNVHVLPMNGVNDSGRADVAGVGLGQGKAGFAGQLLLHGSEITNISFFGVHSALI